MAFVEGFRLLLVLAAAIAGQQIGTSVGPGSTPRVIGLTLGALIGYVIGGVVGRLVDHRLQDSVRRLRGMAAGEVFAGAVIGTTGLLIGLVAGLPLIALVHSTVDYPLVGALAWVLAAFGIRLGIAKGREVVRAAGLSHLLDLPHDPPSSSAMLVDTSALLDRFVLVLGRAGLLQGGIVVPRFVIDEARALAEGPDLVSSRRARRGLEAVEALRARDVDVRIVEDEVPQHDTTEAKALALARQMGVRLATCSTELADLAHEHDFPVIDLRRLAAELTPDHAPGERFEVELVRPGTQPRQAVGYLPDGDMVVVNDAAHLVPSKNVAVVVTSTRQTTQGLLVFAHLAGFGPAHAEPPVEGYP